MSNVQQKKENKMGKTKEFDLEDRLINFAVAMIDLAEMLPNTRSANHISGQLVLPAPRQHRTMGKLKALSLEKILSIK
jgi:hypothetical protein